MEATRICPRSEKDGPCPSPDFRGPGSRREASCVVELSPMSGPKSESLERLDIPLVRAGPAAYQRRLAGNSSIVANDRGFESASRPSWRLWRRKLALDRAVWARSEGIIAGMENGPYEMCPWN